MWVLGTTSGEGSGTVSLGSTRVSWWVGPWGSWSCQGARRCLTHPTHQVPTHTQGYGKSRTEVASQVSVSQT